MSARRVPWNTPTVTFARAPRLQLSSSSRLGDDLIPWRADRTSAKGERPSISRRRSRPSRRASKALMPPAALAAMLPRRQRPRRGGRRKLESLTASSSPIPALH